MEILVVGINYNLSPIQVRERVSFTQSGLDKAYGILKKNKDIKEAVILSTCNRSEITAVVEDVHKGVQTLKKFYRDFFHIEEGFLENYFFICTSKECVQHIFELTAGLKSLVLGEDQILGQVRQAHEQAMEKGNTSTVLNKLFREAVTTAKKIKRETSISQNPLSISSIAVKFIEEMFRDLTDKKVMVIGVGKMSRIAIENLLDKGVKEVYVTNRTKGHAIDLSKKYNGICAIDFGQRYKMIPQVDIIITSTSAPHFVITKEKFEKYFSKDQKLCIVDIAVPRDVELEIGNIQGVSLYELDSLKKVSYESLESRKKAAEDAMGIILEERMKFENWYNCLSIFPVIEELRKYSEDRLTEELDSLMRRLDEASSKDKKLIETVMRSLTKKLIKEPILNLKVAGEAGRGELYGQIVSELFGMNRLGSDQDGGQ